MDLHQFRKEREIICNSVVVHEATGSPSSLKGVSKHSIREEFLKFNYFNKVQKVDPDSYRESDPTDVH